MKEELYRKVYVKSINDLPIRFGSYHTNIGILKFGGVKSYNIYISQYDGKLKYYLQPIEQEESNKSSLYCGNPITTEDTCNVLAKKKTCNGCKYQTKVKQLEEGPNETN